jgi:hypothetical protein
MLNLNLKLFMVLHPAPTTEKFVVDGQPLNVLTYSLFATDLDYDLDDFALSRRLENNQCSK